MQCVTLMTQAKFFQHIYDSCVQNHFLQPGIGLVGVSAGQVWDLKPTQPVQPLQMTFPSLWIPAEPLWDGAQLARMVCSCLGCRFFRVFFSLLQS